jgi:prepilin-type N-terminal cleavage/methylation domain-containing protein
MSTLICRSKRVQQGGFTLAELMVAASIALLISGTTMLLLLQSAQTNAAVFSDVSLDEAANRLQNGIVSYLRQMPSANFPNSAPPPGGMWNYVPSVGPPPAQIAYDANTGTIAYTSTNFQDVLVSTNANISIASCGFYPSFKYDGTGDNTLVNVEFELIHSTFFPTAKTNSVYRKFSVKIMNF